MGTNDEKIKTDGEGPERRVYVDPFSIDTYEISVGQFAKFVSETNYVTEAEEFGWSFVFEAMIDKKGFNESWIRGTADAAPWWVGIDGSWWRRPTGPHSDILDRIRSRNATTTLQSILDMPVTHVSFRDATQFCAWRDGLRLPTEAEWEFAARAGLQRKMFPWGDELRPNGEHRCNIWQGKFPEENSGSDGYVGLSPVTSFPPNGFGLYNMAGNVWEWTQDWFTNRHSSSSKVIRNPRGPAKGTGKVKKGGSFMCHKSYCYRYRNAARAHITADSSTASLGFRCAKSRTKTKTDL